MNTTSIFQSISYLNTILGDNFIIQRYFDLVSTNEFAKLLKVDLEIAVKDKSKLSDQFFEDHARYIQNYLPKALFEIGFMAWINLLKVACSVNKNAYLKVHKGTPFYHGAIFALKGRRFREGLQMMDFAVEEDFRWDTEHKTKGALNKPATLYLKVAHPERGNDFYGGEELYNSLNFILGRVNNLTGANYTVRELKSVVQKKLILKRERARRTAWATLLSEVLDVQNNIDFLVVTPAGGEGQLKAHLSLASLTLVLETLIKKSPAAKKITPSNQKKAGNKAIYNNDKVTINDLYTDIIQPKFNINILNAKLQKAESYSTYAELPKALQNLQTPKWDIEAFKVAQDIRNDINHTFLNTRLTESAYSAIYLLILNAILAVLRGLYT